MIDWIADNEWRSRWVIYEVVDIVAFKRRAVHVTWIVIIVKFEWYSTRKSLELFLRYFYINQLIFRSFSSKKTTLKSTCNRWRSQCYLLIWLRYGGEDKRSICHLFFKKIGSKNNILIIFKWIKPINKDVYIYISFSIIMENQNKNYYKNYLKMKIRQTVYSLYFHIRSFKNMVAFS